MTNLFNYIDRPSPIHRLTGACKLVCLILWTLAAMTSFFTPLLVVMTVAAVILFRLARLKLRDISVTLGLMCVYIVMNNILIFLFSPMHGTNIYGTKTVLFHIAGPYSVTAERGRRRGPHRYDPCSSAYRSFRLIATQQDRSE